MAEQEELLARMFFTDDKVETRPLDWIIFTTPETFDPVVLNDVAKEIPGSEEVYVAFTNKLNGIQIFKGKFVNVRAQRSDRRDQ
jgi:hypothetical protein